jgi:multiple sugar transport system permease protein
VNLVERTRNASVWRPLFTTVAGALIALFLLLPFLWLLISSFMTELEAQSVPPHWIPQQLTGEAYQFLFDLRSDRPRVGAETISQVLPSLRNSALVATSVALCNLALASPAAYALSRLRFRGGQTLMLVYLLTRMVPFIALMIPLYVLIRGIGVLDTPFALIGTYTAFTLPFSIWILHSYFETVPRDLEDAARVDRCGWTRMMLYVFLPVTSPGLVAGAMFAFMWAWNEFLFALLFTSSLRSQTVTVAVAGFVSDVALPRTLMSGAGVLAALPPLLVALLLQRLIMRGLVSGSVKG